jgi:hypothetical protein
MNRNAPCLRKVLWSLVISGFLVSVQAAATLAPNASSSGTLSASHTEDWWTITTTADGSLTVNISTGDANLLEQDANLFDVDGTTLLVHDGENGTTSTLAYSHLLPGTYQVRVYLYSGVGASYSISNTFTAQPIGNNTEPNDSVAAAATMAINTSTPGHLGYYGNGFTDAIDWFKITIPSDGMLTITGYSDTTLEADLNLYDIDGTTALQHDGQVSRTSHVSVPNLKPGTYYFKYYQYSGYGGYTLTSTFTPQSKANDPEPNDTFTQAMTLDPNATTTGHLGYFTNQIMDTKDWYKIQIPSDGILRVFIKTDSTLDADANLFDVDGSTQIFHDGRVGDTSILVMPNLMAGTYYVKPYVYTGYGGYTITSTFIPQPLANDAEPDDTLSKAQALTMNQTGQGHLGYYSNGKTDIYDWFSIVQSTTGPLWVSVGSDSTLDADCDMFSASDLSTVSHDGQSGIHSYVGKDTLAAGTYLVRVKAYTGYGGYKIVAASQQIAVGTHQGLRQAIFKEIFASRATENGAVSLIFALKKPGFGSVRMYTASGRLVGQVFKGPIEAERRYEATVHGISNGIYYAVLSTGEANKVLRISLTR